MIKCGAAELVCTPPFGIMIPGYFGGRIANGLKDELYVKAVVFDDGTEKIALIAIDIIGVSFPMADRIRKAINEAVSIPEKNIMIAATHTHTGSATDMESYGCLPDENAVNIVCDKAADAAALAYRRLNSVYIGYGVGAEYDIGFNRRFYLADGTAVTNPGYDRTDLVGPAGPVDPSVNVVRIDNEANEPVAVLVNYACHLDVVGGSEFCADYPGEMSKVIKKNLGNDVICIFFNGCCGDINHHDFTGAHKIEPQHYKKMGRILGADVLAVREKITVNGDDIKIGAVNEIMELPRRQPSKAQYDAAKKLLEGTPGISERTYAEHHIELYENPVLTRKIEVQALRIGELGISAFPSETFVEVGLEIKEGSPFKYNFTVELANGSCGYVCTAKALKEGGYETMLSKYVNMGEETAEIIAKTSIKLLNYLK